MTGTQSASRGLTRRDFLKVGVAGATGLAAAGSMTGCGAWLGAATQQAADEKTVYTLHQFMCTGRCSLKCTVRDGRLAMIQPNDTVDPYYRHVCVKGISEIQHVYSDERLQSPMRRVGARGEGSFEVISWDEAIKTVGDELRKAWDKYGKQSVYMSASNEPRFGFLPALLGCATGVEPGIDRGTGNGSAPAIGGDVFGGGTNETRDWVNTKTLVISGTNLLESSMMQSNTFLDAKKAGCEIIVLDPHFSTTAGKASKWIPVIPGTDAAFYLGMVSYILDNKLYNEAYMREHTSFPFLMDEATGKLLRTGAAWGTDEETGEPVDPGDFMVWDGAKGAAVPYAEAVATAALEGSFDVDGKKAITVLESLKRNQRPYTCEWAEGVCGASAETIAEVARKYATGGPAYLAFGQGGSDKYSNPDIIGHAGMVLVSLTGNIGKPGCGIGHGIGGGGYSVTLGEWELPEQFKPAELDVRSDRFPDRDGGVHVIISLGNTFQQYWANMNKTRGWIDSLDFIVHIGMYYEDTVKYADIVLPVCSKFEDTVEHSIVRSDYNHVNLQTKCIDPLFESKPDFDVMRLIAEEMGVGEYLPKTAEELVRYQIEHSEDLAEQGHHAGRAGEEPRQHEDGRRRRAAPRLYRPQVRNPHHAHGAVLRGMEALRAGMAELGGEQRGVRRQPAGGEVPAAVHADAHPFLQSLAFQGGEVGAAVRQAHAGVEPGRHGLARHRRRGPGGGVQRPRLVQVRGAREQRRAPRLLPHLGSGLEQVHRGGEHAKRHERPREPAR